MIYFLYMSVVSVDSSLVQPDYKRFDLLCLCISIGNVLLVNARFLARK